MIYALLEEKVKNVTVVLYSYLLSNIFFYYKEHYIRLYKYSKQKL